jgi:hypothetical protein
MGTLDTSPGTVDHYAAPFAVCEIAAHSALGLLLLARGTAMNEGLQSPNTKRWVIRRKAAVLAAVRAGKITIDEASRRYNLSTEELLAWQRAFEIYGLPGLRTTHLQE